MEKKELTPEEQEMVNIIQNKIDNLSNWETHLDLMRGKGVSLEKSYDIAAGERELADEKKKLQEELSQLKTPIITPPKQ